MILFFAAVRGGWFGEWNHTGSRFCEASQPGLIKQPVNTWSNLGFVAAGLFMSWRLWKGRYAQNANALTRSSFYAIFYSSIVIVMGPCSMAMHATETTLGGWLDVLCMHFIAAFITSYALQRFFSLGVVSFLAIFTLLIAGCLYSQSVPVRVPVVGGMGNLVFALLIVVTTVVEMLNSFVRRLHHRIVWGLLSSLTITVAFIIWNLSLTGCPLCNPHSIIQGHGVWHLLCALSLVFLFRFYVSETRDSSREVPAHAGRAG